MPPKDLLTAIEVEKAKPGSKPCKNFGKDGDSTKSGAILIPVESDYSLPDGAGLHLIVTLAGGKWWHGNNAGDIDAVDLYSISRAGRETQQFSRPGMIKQCFDPHRVRSRSGRRKGHSRRRLTIHPQFYKPRRGPKIRIFDADLRIGHCATCVKRVSASRIASSSAVCLAAGA